MAISVATGVRNPEQPARRNRQCEVYFACCIPNMAHLFEVSLYQFGKICLMIGF